VEIKANYCKCVKSASKKEENRKEKQRKEL
jgi:hypothetical protein